jgi:hypothetical protein
MGETDVVVTDQVLTTKPSLFSFPLFLFLVSFSCFDNTYISIIAWRSFPNGSDARKELRSLALTKSEESTSGPSTYIINGKPKAIYLR